MQFTGHTPVWIYGSMAIGRGNTKLEQNTHQIHYRDSRLPININSFKQIVKMTTYLQSVLQYVSGRLSLDSEPANDNVNHKANVNTVVNRERNVSSEKQSDSGSIRKRDGQQVAKDGPSTAERRELIARVVCLTRYHAKIDLDVLQRRRKRVLYRIMLGKLMLKIRTTRLEAVGGDILSCTYQSKIQEPLVIENDEFQNEIENLDIQILEQPKIFKAQMEKVSTFTIDKLLAEAGRLERVINKYKTVANRLVDETNQLKGMIRKDRVEYKQLCQSVIQKDASDAITNIGDRGVSVGKTHPKSEVTNPSTATTVVDDPCMNGPNSGLNQGKVTECVDIPMQTQLTSELGSDHPSSPRVEANGDNADFEKVIHMPEANITTGAQTEVILRNSPGKRLKLWLEGPTSELDPIQVALTTTLILLNAHQELPRGFQIDVNPTPGDDLRIKRWRCIVE